MMSYVKGIFDLNDKNLLVIRILVLCNLILGCLSVCVVSILNLFFNMVVFLF